MNIDQFLNPVILFFFLGVLAHFVKSDFQLPQPITKFISYYLLMSIGLKGGYELHENAFSLSIVIILLVCVAGSLFTGWYVFHLFKKNLGIENAAGLAATYGSVSAVTFITAVSYLEQQRIDFGGYMVAALALMEFPAIIQGIFFVRKNQPDQQLGFRELVFETLTHGSVFILLGSFLIGLISDHDLMQGIKPFTQDIFKGMLCFFLLDLGIVAGHRMSFLSKLGKKVILFGLFSPFFHAVFFMGLAYLVRASAGDALLMAVLGASASYIAVPAAFRTAVPEADPGLYVPLALGITFPVNILIGIPLYNSVIQLLWH
ncbi:MAG: sodium-dependent bicarbonate transport family permease [Thermaurantimonas sp.]|uniref:sodium-dependent bicarbonate transport family permease n=1 Tax=Thermaurantimonas sp. TaxID=2681568 RepID=UPI00391D1486